MFFKNKFFKNTKNPNLTMSYNYFGKGILYLNHEYHGSIHEFNINMKEWTEITENEFYT